MDKTLLKKALTDILKDVAQKAKDDALKGKSDISSVFTNEGQEQLQSLDLAKVEQAIKDIDKATSTKKGASMLINGIMVLAKVTAKFV